MPAGVSYKFGTTAVPYLKVKPGEIKGVSNPHGDMKVFCSPDDQCSGVCLYNRVKVPAPKSWSRFLRFLEPQQYTDGLSLYDIRIVPAGESLELLYPHIIIQHFTPLTV